MIILGIETSCDDTSAAILNGDQLVANITSTQLIHRQFGGVVPELASRSHIELIVPVIEQTFSQADMTLNDIQGIAVTYGPGLAGSLLVGLSTAKGLALSKNLPLIGINHLEGHIWANIISHPQLKPPFVVLLVSGGHTQLVHVKDWDQYELLGRTRDDAAGEAFDKVSKLLDLGYPGGPIIEKKANGGDPKFVRFPRAYLDRSRFDFSFSGLKTAVLTYVQKTDPQIIEKHLSDILASFQAAVVDVLVEKTVNAAKQLHVKHICLAGGVAVNSSLRKNMSKACENQKIQVFWPLPAYCTDNGAMIARAGQYYFERGATSPLTLSPVPSLNI